MDKRVFLALVGAVAALGGTVMVGDQAIAQTQPEWYNCLTREVFTPEKQVWCNRWNTLQNGTYRVPTGAGPEPVFEIVTLENGELAQLPSPERAGMPDGTVVFSQTVTYAVRVFTVAGLPRINLFNRTTGRQELNGAEAIAVSSVEGITFTHAGSTTAGQPSVQVSLAPDGAQTIEVNDIVQTNFATVTGTVTYLPRIAMPPGAVLEVSLVDVSRADAPAIVLASQSTVFGERQVPIPFELVYNPDQIDPRFSYAVQARILVDGQLRFINTSHFGVITQGHPTEIEVQVDPVSR